MRLAVCGLGQVNLIRWSSAISLPTRKSQLSNGNQALTMKSFGEWSQTVLWRQKRLSCDLSENLACLRLTVDVLLRFAFEVLEDASSLLQVELLLPYSGLLEELESVR